MLAAWQNLRPLPRAAITSGTLMAVGDGLCQVIQHNRLASTAAAAPKQKQQQEGSSNALSLDLARTARFAVIGLTLHGPFFFTGFQWLDRQFGKAATFRNAITKSLAGQLTLFPTYTPAFLLYSSLLEGSSLDQSIERVKQRLPVLLVTGSLYWPVVNVLNFKYVPPHQRVLAMNLCAIAWNSYLSYISTAPLPSDKEGQK